MLSAVVNLVSAQNLADAAGGARYRRRWCTIRLPLLLAASTRSTLPRAGTLHGHGVCWRRVGLGRITGRAVHAGEQRCNSRMLALPTAATAPRESETGSRGSRVGQLRAAHRGLRDAR